MEILPFEALPLESSFVRELRSDHAGEVGAVEIYRGMLAVTRSPELQSFAARHMEAELRHRRFFDAWLPRQHQSRLLWLWRASGWLLGAGAALLGTRVAYQTVASVETFVEGHYEEQLESIAGILELEPLRARLEEFCREEVEHRQDASRRLAGGGTRSPGRLASAWNRVVGGGSALGVALARRI